MEKSSRSPKDIPLQPATELTGGEKGLPRLFSFRPYQEQTGTRPRSKETSVKPVETNLGAHKIVFSSSEVTKAKSTNTPANLPRGPPGAKQKSYAPASAQLVVQGSDRSTSSPSSASAVGTVPASSLQSHRTLVERQIGKILGAQNTSGDLGEHWMPDHLCHECSECNTKFGIFTRRHHCRICGRIFCHQCSATTIPARVLRPGLTGNLRVCQQCFHIFNDIRTGGQPVEEATPSVTTGASTTASTPDISSPLSETESTATPSFTPSMSSRITWETATRVSNDTDPLVKSPSRHNNVQVIEFDNPTPHRQSSVRHSINDENILALAEDEVEYQLQEIWEKLRDPSQGLIFQTHRHRLRVFYQSLSAPEIVEWLLRHGHAYSRDMAIRIGQALVDTKCLKVVSSAEQTLRDHHHIFLEMGEAGDVISYNRPMVADAPNWFLSEDGEENVNPSSALSSRTNPHMSEHETSLSIERTNVSFHTQKSSGGDGKSPLQQTQPHAARGTSDRLGLVRRGLEMEVEPSVYGGPVDVDGVSSKAAKLTSPQPTKDLPSPTAYSISSYSILDHAALLRAIPISGLSRVSEAARDYGSENSFRQEVLQTLLGDYQANFDSLLAQLVRTSGLSLSWIEVIHPLIMDACRTVHTHIISEDFMDIRHYVKVKKIPGGRKTACSLISGVVFSKHVSHKKMQLSVRSPRILLLKCAFEFQRRADRLSSFDTLLSQEQEYLKNLVERVKKFLPNIILVQRSVSRFALELLHNSGIVVVVNVKPAVMQRMARSTQGDLLHSLDQLSFKETRIGTCGHFYVKTFTLPDGIRKTLMYFDECEPKLGGAIMLQGADNHELKRVKEVVLFGLYAMNNMRLETSFLADEFACPVTSVVDQTGNEDYYTPPSTPELTLFPFSSPINAVQVPIEEMEDRASENSFIEVEGENETLEYEESTPDTDGPCHDGEKEQVAFAEETANVTEDTTLVKELSEEDVEEDTDCKSITTLNGEDESWEESLKLAQPSPQPTPEVVFANMIKKQLMSISPHVTFPTPYLQTERGMEASTRCYLPKVIYWSHWFQIPTGKQQLLPSHLMPPHNLGAQSLFRTGSVHHYSEQHSLRHSYKSVSNHPFTSCRLLLPIDSNERKAVLADFRARATLPDEPDCFFFPSARAGADVYSQLAKIFSRSREFEMKAEGITASGKGDDSPDGLSTTRSQEHKTVVQQRAKRWTCPEKDPYSSSSSSTSSGSLPEMKCAVLSPNPQLSNVLFKYGKENTRAQIGLSEVLETGSPSPEPPRPPSVEDKTKLAPCAEWCTLMAEDELMQPSVEQLDCLDPYNHQLLSTMFSSTCHDGQKHLYPCVSPCIIPMNYYGRNDITLGEFLQRYCFRSVYMCQSCDVEMAKHQRHFIHGTLELRVVVHTLPPSIPLNSSNTTVYTWLSCSKCPDAPSTPLLAMSQDSLYFSFAKFLELKFYGTNYAFFPHRDKTASDESPVQACPHSLHPYYTQFFSFQNKLASFEIQPVNIMEVRIPPQQVTLEKGWSITHFDYPNEVKHLSRLIEGVFYRILQYLDIFPSVEVIMNKIQESKERAKAMQANLRQKTSRLKDLTVTSGTYHDTEPESSWDRRQTDLMELQDGIASLKRSICDVVACWNLELEDLMACCKVMSRKDPSPRESASLEEPPHHSPVPSPQLSPTSKRKSLERMQAPSVVVEVCNTPLVSSQEGQRSLATPKDHLKPATAVSENTNATQHRRQLSDSVTLGKAMPIPEEDSLQGEMGMEEMHKVDAAPTIGARHLRHRSLTDMVLVNKRKNEIEEVEGELSRTLKDEEYSDQPLAITHEAEDIMDFINKLRGREVEADPSKFYSLYPATPIHVYSVDTADGGEPKSSKNGPVKKAGSASFLGKAEDLEAGSKPAEKAKPSDPLQYLLSRPSFTRLPSPFELSEHHMFKESKLKFPVSVYENEPMSIIAFALCSWEYQHELELIGKERRKTSTLETDTTQQLVLSKPVEGDGLAVGSSKPSGLQQIKKVLYRTFQSAGMPLDESSSPSHDAPEQFDEAGGEEGVKWNASPDPSHKFSSSHESLHVSMEFADDTTKFFCKVYYAEEFQRLREEIFPDGEDQYTRSLGRCVKYHAKGGKSRAMFLKTVEDRLILKQVQLVEITAFIEIANEYFQHVEKALEEGRPLVLAKILGAYSIGFRNSKTGRSKKLHVIIMENLLYGHNCERVFDLKGSMRGRYVTQDPKKQDTKGDVLMDENFLEYSYCSPVYMWPHSKVVLMQAILADTQFLANNHIMDYSLLVALDKEKGEVVVGVIDFVRPFTFDKRIEMYLKKAGRSVLPTVVYPDLYRKRFIEAMDRYFTAVPDKWTGLGADIRMSI